MFHRKAYFLLIGCWLTVGAVFSQDQRIADSLAQIYKQNTLTDTAKFPNG